MQRKHVLRIAVLTVMIISMTALSAFTLCWAGVDAQVTTSGAAIPMDVGVDGTRVINIPGTPLPAVNSNDPGQIIAFMLQAIKESKWAWLIGLVLMLLTWVFNRILKNKIPKKVLPWVAISLGVTTSAMMSFASGMLWYEAIGNGVTLGLAAAGGWSVVGKSLLNKKQE